MIPPVRLLTHLGGSVLLAAAFASCGSGTPAPAATPAAARPASSFGRSLSLAVSLGSALRAGDASVTANFALTNTGSTVFDGCFGQSWGLSVIVGSSASACPGTSASVCARAIIATMICASIMAKPLPMQKR